MFRNVLVACALLLSVVGAAPVVMQDRVCELIDSCLWRALTHPLSLELRLQVCCIELRWEAMGCYSQ